MVTEFTFRLHPVPENIYGGLILFEREAAGDLFRYFDRFIDDAPREYGGFPAWHLAPPLPFIPADRVGEPFPVLVSCWTGDHEEGAKVLQGFRDVGPVMAEHVGAIPYTALNSLFDPLLPRGLQETRTGNGSPTRSAGMNGSGGARCQAGKPPYSRGASSMNRSK